MCDNEFYDLNDWAICFNGVSELKFRTRIHVWEVNIRKRLIFFLAGSENIHEQSPACHAAGQTAGPAVPIAVFLLTTVCQHSHSDKPLIFPFHLHLLHHLVPGECAYLMCNDTQVTHCQQSTTVRDIYTSTSPHSHTQIHHWEANVHFHMISGIIWYDNNQALNKKWQGEFWWFFPKK